jgi:hypothetical protein
MDSECDVYGKEVKHIQVSNLGYFGFFIQNTAVFDVL